MQLPKRWMQGVLGGAFVAFASTPAPAQPEPPQAAPQGAWRLVWSDEFQGAAGAPIAGGRWTFDLGDGCGSGNCGWGNQEKQWYTSDPANASLTGDGMLAIVARRASAGSTCYYGPCRYTSAKVKTSGRRSVRHGRVEARIRLPAGQGLWPAFWMLGDDIASVGWPASGELDIMEHHGSMPGNVSSAMHGPGYNGDAAIWRAYTPAGANFTTGFHVYAVEWDSSAVHFFVDEVEHFAVTRAQVEARGTWAFDRPFYIILNLAVGGTFDGDPKSDDVLPATMLVDYVRVFERAP